MDTERQLEDRLMKTKCYRLAFGKNILEDWARKEFLKFTREHGYIPWNSRNIVYWILHNITGWSERQSILKNNPNGTEVWHRAKYGESNYKEIYKATNFLKGETFRDSEVQRKNASKVVRGKIDFSPRQKHYWINRYGLSETDAVEKVKEFQSTNKLSNYVSKYGAEVGKEKYEKRKSDFTELMKNPEIGKKRSLGLWRYIERYGETKGTEIYLKMRKKRNSSSRMGRASKESLIVLDPITKFLDSKHIKYYIGVEGNKEWFIRNSENFFFYDLTIPSLSTIIEYHGEVFHPNPKTLSESEWSAWKQPFSLSSADEVHENDIIKKETATTAGWEYYEIFSSDSKIVVDNILNFLNKSLS